MTLDVLVYEILTTYSGSWNSNTGTHTLQAGNFLHVRLDTDTFLLTVDYANSSTEGAGYLGTLTDGPHLYYGFDGAVSLLTIAPFWQACDGTTLKKVITNNLFPYGNVSSTPDALECVIAPVCDLEVLVVSVTEATGPSNADGSATVAGTSSNGTIKYSLDAAFDYATQGQLSPIFSGLLPGDYTIYAKDSIGCTDNVSVTIKVTTAYGLRLILGPYTDQFKTFTHKTEIYERAYAGASEEICGGAKPNIVRWNGDENDPDLSLIPSKIDIELMTESAGQFQYLFEGDDRKFKVIHYVNNEIYWTGFVKPQLYHEPYIFEPFPVSIIATDGLAELKDAEFRDEFGNLIKDNRKSIKVIAEILKKTGLGLSIRSGLNIFDSGMTDNTSVTTNDPLDQAFVDPLIYQDEDQTPKPCDEVIKSIPEPFRAKIFQSMGYWWITRQADAVGTYTFRQFDVNGDYEDDDSINPVIDLKPPSDSNRAAWALKQQHKYFMRNYGYFSITHRLAKDGNMIDTGRFEEQDIIDLGSGNKIFKDWNFFQAQAGAKYGFERLFNGKDNSKGAFFLDLETVNVAQADNILYSKQIPFVRNGLMRIKFDYSVTPRYNYPWIRLGWSVKIVQPGNDDKYITDKAPADFIWFNADDSEVINDLYITSFNSMQTFECLAKVGNVNATSGYVEVKIYMHNHYGRDYADITALKAYDIEADPFSPGRIGKKVMVGGSGVTYLYTSEVSSDADSPPEVVRPTNYGSEQILWRLDKIINQGPGIGLVNKFLIDNLSVAFFYLEESNSIPTDPPENLIYDEEVNQFVIQNLNKEVVLGDMIRFRQEYEDNERELYKGYFRLEDGTPTQLWKRDGVDEAKRLLQITLEDYRDQYRDSRMKLNGTLLTDTLIHFVNAIQDQFSGSRLAHTEFEFNCKDGLYNVNLVEMLTGEGGEPPYVPADFNDDFNDDFEI